MVLEQEIINDILIARVRGDRLTSNEAADMKTTLLRLIAEDAEGYIINLKNIQMMDSTGLGSLLFGVRQADTRDKDMCFCEIQPRIQSLIRIAQLEEIMPIYQTEADALADFEDVDDDSDA